jgi:hypothetical protein
MSLLFVDGFDHYLAADVTKKWSTSSSVTIDASAGRRSGGCLKGTTTLSVTKTLPANLATIICGFAIKVEALTSNSFLSIKDAGSIQTSFNFQADGSVQAKRAGSTPLGTSSPSVMTINAFHYVECKCTIHDTTGYAEVRINGVTVLTCTNVDTKNSANAYGNVVELLGVTTSTYFDDCYICDTIGGSPSGPTDDFLGDCRVDILYPNADGTYSQFTPSTGTDHYALVDETTPNTSDYNEEGTAGEKDSYNMQNLSAITGTIYGVQVSAAVLKDDAGARSIKVGVRSSSTDSVSASQALSTSQLYYRNIHETDPATNAVWTESGVNAAEALVECV